MGRITAFNDDWTFHEGFDARLTREASEGEAVRLPHNAVDLPIGYFDETAYQRRFTYQKTVAWTDAFEGREVSLVFDGAMADAVVWLNGERVAAHTDGYTPFEARLTDGLRRGENLITVRIDGSENPEIPPFGDRIDYLTYAGIYRDVWLRVTGRVSIDAVKIETPDALASAKSVVIHAEIRNAGEAADGTLRARLLDGAGSELAAAEAEVAGGTVTLLMDGLTGIALWDVDDPALHSVALELDTPGGSDRMETRFGFRTAEFAADGFRLNGRLLKIRGLNRHQSWPHAGYAMGRRAQERDADILKHDLKCNLVRCSHYPQSPWFLDHCDRIGLMVFEEIPGWQHIGGEAWRDRSVENVRAMIRRDWNHPSIVIWGVRINESQDHHDFYAETNRVARETDPTRQTGGVRFIDDSEMLEDVYTMNDFVLGSEELPGANRGRIALRPQAEVTGLKAPVPYLVTEFNGHMHPTKRADQEQRQAEHVTRYLQILNAAYGDPAISGCVGWCFADYNTHADFGSGDRICHHGVLDMFREPKFAAHVYASQGDPADGVVMEPVTRWARGERNIGGALPLIVLTNCDEVEFRYGDTIRRRVGPDRESYPHLPRPPVVIDRRHFPDGELGLWGMSWHDMTLTGFIDGAPVAERRMVADPVSERLEVAADAQELRASEKDAVRVIVRALDQAGNVLPFFADPLRITVAGPARVIGPELVSFSGGIAGFWIETAGAEGAVSVEVRSARFDPVSVRFDVRG
jgi:beta-galactosidase